MRAVLVGTLLAIACQSGESSSRPPPSPLESAIATDLTKRYGVALAVTCHADRTSCTAHAPGIDLPIRLVAEDSAIAGEGRRWIDWTVDGVVVRAEQIENYVKEELAELGHADLVDCGLRLRRVVDGERIACELGRGGKAFATIAADGSMSFEIDLDPAAGNARAEPVSDERERELLEMSRQLDVSDAVEE